MKAQLNEKAKRKRHSYPYVFRPMSGHISQPGYSGDSLSRMFHESAKREKKIFQSTSMPPDIYQPDAADCRR